MEQHLGHRTYYLNLRRHVEPAPISSRWIEVTYMEPGGLWERLPMPLHARGTLRGRSQVRRELADGSDEVVFFNTQVPAVLGGDVTRRRPYVLSTDITPIQYDRMGRHYNHAADRPGPLQIAKHFATMGAFRSASFLLPWSSWARDSLVADYGVDPNRVAVLPPGVDLGVWSPAARRHGGPPRILFVGGDLWRKGGATLLDAFRALPAGSAELILVTRSEFAGGPNIRVLRDMRPNTPELIDLFRSADIFALPSAGEAFGIAAVEASAIGLPVVATGVGGLTDIVRDGESGLLVPPSDARALAERLALLVGDPQMRLRMGHAARAHAEARFDADSNAKILLNVLTHIVETKRELACRGSSHS